MIETWKTITSWATLSNLASVASIFGLMLTIYVSASVRSIRRAYLFRARIPALQKQLQNHASSISSYLQTFPESHHKIAEELSLAEVNASSLMMKTSGRVKGALKSLVKEIREFRTNQGTKEALRSIYLNMNMVIQEIANLREDDKWGARDG